MEVSAISKAAAWPRRAAAAADIARAKATPKSDIEISARADDRQVALSVRDYGPGVPDDLLSRIFEPFFRVDVTRTPSTGGVGLGLAIVEKALARMGGALELDNAADGGLVAHIRLKRAP